MQQEPTSQFDEPDDVFAREFAGRQRLLFSYLLTLLSRPEDAEEVLQEDKCGDLEEAWRLHAGYHFVAWATTIAHHQAQAFRRRRQRSFPSLPSDLLDQIAQESEERVDLQEARSHALSFCVEKLTAKDAELVRNQVKAWCSMPGIAM